jgi:nicotinate-nucleotide adenylyltransferase
VARVRVGVLGGTFDPIHIAHLLLAEQAREQLVLDKVLLIPAGDPWRKAGRDIAPAALRLEMVRLAAAGNPYLEVDDREVRRNGATYTVDTLRELRAVLDEEDDLFLILGEDALVDLPNWKDPETLAEYATIAVAPREGFAEPESLPFDPALVERIDMPFVDISASDLRTRARLGQSLRYMAPDAVIKFIAERGLYQG